MNICRSQVTVAPGTNPALCPWIGSCTCTGGSVKVVVVTFLGETGGATPGSPLRAEAAALGAEIQTCSAAAPAARPACCTAGIPSSPPAI